MCSTTQRRRCLRNSQCRATRGAEQVLIVAFALLVVPMAGFATAQDRSGPEAEVAVGWVGFADDGIASESLVGGAARWYVRPRISVGPELVYMGGSNHSHLMATGNVTWDMVGSRSRRPLTPFLVVGAGVFQTRETLFTGTFTSHEGAFTAGGGVRAMLGDRVMVGVDTRVGWELHLRLSGFVGLRLRE